MIPILLVHIAILFLLLLCSAFFSSAEVAFFSLNPLKIRQLVTERPHAGPRIARALTNPTRLLSTILIGNTLVNVCASVVALSFVKALGSQNAATITIPIITLLLLVFGEIGPKRIAIHRNEWMAAIYAPLLLFLIQVTAPIRLILEQVTRNMKKHFTPTGEVLTEEEFETLVEISQETGVLDESETDMVKSIMKLEELRASDIMSPRVDIIGVDLSESAVQNDQLIRRIRVPRMLLYRDQLDDIQGILNVRAYLLDPDHSIKKATLPVCYVPECARLNYILELFQTKGHRIAVVVDEYGGTAGIITRGDILEEIAGEIATEHNTHKLQIEEFSAGHWLVDGQISLEDLNDELGLNLDAEGVDRLAGWLTVQAEHLPHPGEVIEAQSCRAIVRQMRRHRITLVEIIQLKDTE